MRSPGIRFFHAVFYLSVITLSLNAKQVNNVLQVLNNVTGPTNFNALEPYGFRERKQSDKSVEQNQPERHARILNPANPFQIFGSPNCQHEGYEGTCYEAFQCWVLGGRVGPLCQRLRGTCCRFFRSCGMRSSQELVYFSNNKFDGSIPASLPTVFADMPDVCDLLIVKRTENYCGIRIEPSIDPEMIDPATSGDGTVSDESCTDAILSITGLPKKTEFSLCNQRDAFTRKRYEINITKVPELKIKVSSFGGRSGAPVDVKIRQIKCSEFTGEDIKGTVLPGGGSGGTGEGGGGIEGGGGGGEGTPGGGTTDVKTPAPPIPVTDKPPGPPAPPPPPPSGSSFSACGIKGTSRKIRREMSRAIEDRQEHENEPKGPPIVRPTKEFRQEVPGPTWDAPTNNETIFAYLMGPPSLQATRITNGLETAPNEFPWQVAMFKSDNKFHCGASIIADFYVLTAAHCVINFINSPQSLILRLGEWSLASTSGGQHVVAHIAKITVHPQYSRTNLQNDVAVLKLKQRIEFSKRMRPVCLPRTDIPLKGEMATITGWGKNEHGSLEDKLNHLTAVIIDNAACSAKWGGSGFIVPSMMCMDPQVGDSCNGDSGGPSVIEVPANSGKYYQVGIVSFGSGSCTDKKLPGVYTRVTFFRDWIFRQMV